MRHFYKYLLGICFLSLFLTACCPTPSSPYIYRHYTHQDYIDMLQKQGVRIIRTGETYKVIIPSDKLFYPHSANFTPEAHEILGPLTPYLRYYETTFMRISAYSDDGGSLSRSLALTKRQAQRLLHFLTFRGMDARIMLASGFGPYRPIADNSILSHRELNRRIEIKFRKVIVPPLV